MENTKSQLAADSRYELKTTAVDLISKRDNKLVSTTIEQLEAIRTSQSTVPASTSALEAICGASCETSAQ